MALEELPNIVRLMSAAQIADVDQFNILLKKCSEPELDQLFNQQDEFNNTLLHYFFILQAKKWSFNGDKESQARIDMCSEVFKLDQKHLVLKCLNTRNNEGLTPFHLAIKLGYSDIVDQMLALGIDLSVNAAVESTLEFAAKHKPAIYKKLLKKHVALNQKGKAQGFTAEQIQKASEIYIDKLKRKKFLVGLFGSFMTIACPTGAVFAFNNIPLLEFVFAAILSAGAATWVGLVVGVGCGLAFLYSAYNKTLLKYGPHAQELAALEATNAQIARLTAELKDIDKQLALNKSDSSLATKKQTLTSQLEGLYNKALKVEDINRASNSKWAKKGDVWATRIMSGASFACAFSGVLGILGFFTQFLPAAALTAVVLAGIPIVGWVALGVSVVVAGAVAYWAYKQKFQPILEQTGAARRQLHEMKLQAWNARTAYYDQKKVPGYQVKDIQQLLPSSAETPTPSGSLSPQSGPVGDVIKTDPESSPKTSLGDSLVKKLPVMGGGDGDSPYESASSYVP